MMKGLDMRSLVALGVVLVLYAVVPARAVAQTSSLEEAKARFKQGQTHYNLDEWKEAATKFKEAYRLHPDPIFLFNIAQCHRMLGEPHEALSFYRKYQRAIPDAPNRGYVAKRIEELNATVAAAQKVAPAPVPSPTPPPAVLAPAPAPAAAIRSGPLWPPPPPPPASDATMLTASAAPPADVRVPMVKRWWVWTALGAVAVGGAVVAIVIGGHKSESPPMMGFTGDLAPGRILVPSR